MPKKNSKNWKLVRECISAASDITGIIGVLGDCISWAHKRAVSDANLTDLSSVKDELNIKEKELEKIENEIAEEYQGMMQIFSGEPEQNEQDKTWFETMVSNEMDKYRPDVNYKDIVINAQNELDAADKAYNNGWWIGNFFQGRGDTRATAFEYFKHKCTEYVSYLGTLNAYLKVVLQSVTNHKDRTVQKRQIAFYKESKRYQDIHQKQMMKQHQQIIDGQKELKKLIQSKL